MKGVTKTMPHKQVLLREDIDNLGARGEIVRVKAGYARNYLLPRRLAVEATVNNVRQIEGERAALLKREAKERSSADAQAGQLRNLTLKFERKVGEAGVLYGSVTSMDIAHALKEQGYEIDRRRIVLREPNRQPRRPRRTKVPKPKSSVGSNCSHGCATPEGILNESALAGDRDYPVEFLSPAEAGLLSI